MGREFSEYDPNERFRRLAGSSPASICPYLACKSDPHTHARYPTEKNACFSLGRGKSIDLAQQEAFCLTEQHPRCEVYRSRKPGA